jgi:hypothetical protein
MIIGYKYGNICVMLDKWFRLHMVILTWIKLSSMHMFNLFYYLNVIGCHRPRLTT